MPRGTTISPSGTGASAGVRRVRLPRVPRSSKPRRRFLRRGRGHPGGLDRLGHHRVDRTRRGHHRDDLHRGHHRGHPGRPPPGPPRDDRRRIHRRDHRRGHRRDDPRRIHHRDRHRGHHRDDRAGTTWAPVAVAGSAWTTGTPRGPAVRPGGGGTRWPGGGGIGLPGEAAAAAWPSPPAPGRHCGRRPAARQALGLGRDRRLGLTRGAVGVTGGQPARPAGSAAAGGGRGGSERPRARRASDAAVGAGGLGGRRHSAGASSRRGAPVGAAPAALSRPRGRHGRRLGGGRLGAGSGSAARRLLGAGLRLRLGLGLPLAGRGVGEAADAVGRRVVDARGVALHADLELVGELEHDVVVDAQLSASS